MPAHPVTPDGRYLVVRGRLWRKANPALPPALRTELVGALMAARRAVGTARRKQDAASESEARAIVDRVKRQLGERGPPWWLDGAPDYNRHLVRNTPYARWYDGLDPARPSARVDEKAGADVT
ncbi:hypothetical protein SAMN03159338_2244 [Sphingomonas sp. NFR04]|uniref:hypothetical protein n=1 Tax=Sphingomonas sp. NFR04 TaxID=1566283 RepID=UPI0008EE7BAB|nr:hypothetical protein [Sphingomonas sp. NFR04]SFJ70483.1 hypothetical protein SAMN03159338_2244 [Sphingomonas sp. NFR04]